jgi:septum formation protein
MLTLHQSVLMKIVLASESPFRRRAMDMLGIAYETRPSYLDEKSMRADTPAELTRKLAEAKAWKVAEHYPDAVIIAGDAVATKAGNLYEKPASLDEAAQFLRELSGGTFQFITSLVVLRVPARRILSSVETCDITFRRLLDREIQTYIHQYPVMNYAGAFEEDAVRKFGERVCGSYNIGTALPVSKLIVFLREQGVEV